jgi:hypothetical protein
MSAGTSNPCGSRSRARQPPAASDPSPGQRARTNARQGSCLLRRGSRVTKTVTTGRDSPRSRAVTASHRVTGNPSSSHTASRHSAAQPASQAGRRRFDSGRPLQWPSGVTARAVAPDATASFSGRHSRLWPSASSLFIAHFPTASRLGHQESHHRVVTVWWPERSSVDN